MEIQFAKYHGAGNDFILLDNRQGIYDELTDKQIQFLCDRRFGIGADGLIKINSHPTLDFEADYYNADASKSFCGNGGRCAVAFANKLGIDVSSTSFLGYDGLHDANLQDSLIHLGMNNVNSYKQFDKDYEVYTGSPHYIHFTSELSDFDMYNFGRTIRYNETYKSEGINVNAVEILGENQLFVRTYERGVEDETLACGTGVTAAAMAYCINANKTGQQTIEIRVMGGNLKVKFDFDGQIFRNVWLIGEGTFVFEGTIHV
ncbi:MAG TPA: diaminopimelate epimerase [Taishania sp.]|nr:diaminopimelate epimerase [Taishania sp.]